MLARGTRHALEEAAGLYRGDLLEGLVIRAEPFEDRLLAERERLREVALEALAHLLADQAAGASAEPAIRTGLRMLRIDPLQEAVHYTHAGDAGKAIAYLAKLAEATRQRHALTDAVRALDQALAFVDQLPVSERDVRRVRLLLAKAFVLGSLGRYPETLPMLLPELPRVESLGDPRLAIDIARSPVTRGTGTAVMGSLKLGAGQPGEAVSPLADGIEHLERFGFRSLGSRFMASLAEAHLASGDLASAGTWAERRLNEAFAIFADLPAALERAHTHVLAAELAARRADTETANRHLRDALRLYRELDVPRRHAAVEQLAHRLRPLLGPATTRPVTVPC